MRKNGEDGIGGKKKEKEKEKGKERLLQVITILLELEEESPNTLKLPHHESSTIAFK